MNICESKVRNKSLSLVLSLGHRENPLIFTGDPEQHQNKIIKNNKTKKLQSHMQSY